MMNYLQTSSRLQRVISEGLAYLLFAIVIAYSLATLHYGIDMNHEGFSVSTPLRYALGDLPFRDEVGLFGRGYDIVMWPIFSLFPNIGLYALRLIGVGLIIGTAFGLYLLLKRFCPSWLVAASLIAFIFPASLEGNQAPSYQLLGTHLLYLSVILWCFACINTKWKWTVFFASLAGIIYFLGLVSNFNLFMVPIVPGIFIVIGLYRKKRDSAYLEASFVFLTVSTLLVLTSVVFLFTNGLMESFIESYEATMDGPLYNKPLTVKIIGLIGSVWARKWDIVVWVVGICYLYYMMHIINYRRPSLNAVLASLAIFGSLCIGFYLIAPHYQPLPHPYRRLGFSRFPYLLFDTTVCFHVLALLVKNEKGYSRVNEGTWKIAKTAILLSIGALFVTKSVFSGNGFYGAIYGISPIYAIGIVSIARSGFAKNRIGVLSLTRYNILCVGLGIFCLILGFFNFRHHYQVIPDRDKPIKYLTESFTHPKLRGIKSTPRRVKAIEQTLNFLKPLVKPGDYLFAYDDIPMFYYLTDTRPAVKTVFFERALSTKLKKKSVDYMIQHKRIPKYAIRCVGDWFKTDATGKLLDYSVDPKIDPANAFIHKNYKVIKTIFPFDIWERKDVADDF